MNFLEWLLVKDGIESVNTIRQRRNELNNVYNPSLVIIKANNYPRPGEGKYVCIIVGTEFTRNTIEECKAQAIERLEASIRALGRLDENVKEDNVESVPNGADMNVISTPVENVHVESQVKEKYEIPLPGMRAMDARDESHFIEVSKDDYEKYYKIGKYKDKDIQQSIDTLIDRTRKAVAEDEMSAHSSANDNHVLKFSDEKGIKTTPVKVVSRDTIIDTLQKYLLITTSREQITDTGIISAQHNVIIELQRQVEHFMQVTQEQDNRINQFYSAAQRKSLVVVSGPNGIEFKDSK